MMRTWVIMVAFLQQAFSAGIYDVTIETGNDVLAGTNAKVLIRLYGENGTSDLTSISSDKRSFQQNSSDSFKVDFKKDLGDPIRIVIGHDNSGPDPRWNLQKVLVKKADSPMTATFVVNKWLESNSPFTTYVEVDKQEKGDCGSAAAKSRVVNGVSSSPNQWPWQVQIKFLQMTGPHYCGGTLIHPQYVLTASHCFQRVKTASQYKFKLGEHDLSKAETSEQEIKAVDIIIHEKWNPQTFENDIALVKLERPAMLNDQVKLACLPEQGKSPQPGEKCIISGWGKERWNGQFPNVLRHAELPVVSSATCKKTMSFSLSPNVSVTDNMICGGGNMKSGCNGDSGGPYVCPNHAGKYIVEGVVSWGHPLCALYPYYSVFARVSEYVDWIESKIYSNYIDPSNA